MSGVLIRIIAFTRTVSPRIWGILGAIQLASGGLWLWGHKRYQAGVQAERARWEKLQEKAKAEADKRAEAQRAAVHEAEQADGNRRTQIQGQLAPLKQEVNRYVEETDGMRDCIDDALRLQLGKGIAAANAVTTRAAKGQ